MTLSYRHLNEVWPESVQQMLDPPRGVPCDWWPKFTNLLGGFRPNEVTLLCAPTGTGKTQLLANISAQLLCRNTPHFVAPVETGDIDYGVRVASALSAIELNNGDAQGSLEVAALTDRYKKLLSGPMWIGSYDNRVECEEMTNMLIYQHQEHGVEVALLDNLNFFLKVVSSHMEKAEMDNAIHEFIMLVKKLPLHVILVVHPKKTDGGRVLSEFDIKGSATAVQEAQNVCLFNRPEEDDIVSGKRLITARELVFRKIRKRGYNVGKKIWLHYDGGRYQEEK